jgi:hypothetical protein
MTDRLSLVGGLCVPTQGGVVDPHHLGGAHGKLDLDRVIAGARVQPIDARGHDWRTVIPSGRFGVREREGGRGQGPPTRSLAHGGAWVKRPHRVHPRD